MHDVFISHSSKDKTTADAVCACLESAGIRCWIAPRDIVAGKEWGEAIVEAIDNARLMVLVFSGNANSARPVKLEVQRAIEKGITVVPLRCEDILPNKSLEFFISDVHWLDAFPPPIEQHLSHLTTTVKKLLAGEPDEDDSSEVSGTMSPKNPIVPPSARSRSGKTIASTIVIACALAAFMHWYPRTDSSSEIIRNERVQSAEQSLEEAERVQRNRTTQLVTQADDPSDVELNVARNRWEQAFAEVDREFVAEWAPTDYAEAKRKAFEAGVEPTPATAAGLYASATDLLTKAGIRAQEAHQKSLMRKNLQKQVDEAISESRWTTAEDKLATYARTIGEDAYHGAAKQAMEQFRSDDKRSQVGQRVADQGNDRSEELPGGRNLNRSAALVREVPKEAIGTHPAAPVNSQREESHRRSDSLTAFVARRVNSQREESHRVAEAIRLGLVAKVEALASQGLEAHYMDETEMVVHALTAASQLARIAQNTYAEARAASAQGNTAVDPALYQRFAGYAKLIHESLHELATLSGQLTQAAQAHSAARWHVMNAQSFQDQQFALQAANSAMDKGVELRNRMQRAVDALKTLGTPLVSADLRQLGISASVMSVNINGMSVGISPNGFSTIPASAWEESSDSSNWVPGVGYEAPNSEQYWTDEEDEDEAFEIGVPDF